MIKFYLEFIFAKCLNFLFGKPPKDLIPKDTQYCYKLLETTIPSKKRNGFIKIEPCPYFRSHPTKNMSSACLYVGFCGFDLAHWDQCKICGISNWC